MPISLRTQRCRAWHGLALSVALVAFVDARAGVAQDFDREVAFLTIPSGARVVGMGRAGASLAGELQSMNWNPAVLASVRHLTPLLSHYDGPLSFRVNQLALAVPAANLGMLAISITVQSFGDIQLSGPGSSNAVVGEISPNNLIASVSFARELPGRLSLGVSAKWIRSELFAELTGSTAALDAGLLWRPLDAMPLHLGLSALNLGRGLRVGENSGSEPDPLPSRARFGASYDVLKHLRPESGLQLLVAADFEHALRDFATGSQFFGAELGVRDVIFVRGGFVAETLIETNTGTTFGLGIELGPVRLDLGRELGVNQLGDETHVSGSARF